MPCPNCACKDCDHFFRRSFTSTWKFHRNRMEALKLPERNCLSPEELTRLYNKNVERAYDYGIESITGVPK